MSLSASIRTGLYGAMQVAGEQTPLTVAGTTMVVNGLDLASDGEYFIRVEIAGDGAQAGVTLTYNTDTTATNYANEHQGGYLTTGYTVDGNTGYATEQYGAGYYTSLEGRIGRDVSGRATAFLRSMNTWPSGYLVKRDVVHRYLVAANVNRLVLTGNFGIGSWAKVYKIGSPTTANGGFTYTQPSFSQVASLLHGEGLNGSTTFTDQIAGNTWTPNNATISTTQAWAGSASMKFTGASNSSIKMPTNSGFNFGSGDWAVEFRAYPAGTHQAFAHIFQTRDGDVACGISFAMGSSGGNELNLGMSSNGSSNDIFNGSSLCTLKANAWNSILLQCKNDVGTLWLNGSRVVAFQMRGLSPYYNASDSIVLGGNATGTSRSFNGYIDEFRFTKGFAPITELILPTSAFPDS